MKNIFLRTTSTDKFYNYLKNLDIGSCAKNFSENIKIDDNFENNLSLKDRIKIRKKSHLISIKFNKVFFKYLKKNLKNSITYREWEIIFYPWLRQFIFLILNRKKIVDKFFLNKKYTNIYLSNVIREEKDFYFNSAEEIASISNYDYFNNYVITKIINYTKKNIFFLKKKVNFKNTNNQNRSLLEKICFNIKFFFQFFFAKISYNLNNIVFETYYCSKIEFFKLCLKLKIFPYKISVLFDEKFNSLYDNKLRNQFLSDILSHKFSFEEKLIIKILVPLIPKNFIENIDLIINKYKCFNLKKKIITCISFYNNELFRVYLILAKRKKSTIIHCDHGGGLSGLLIPDNYILKKLFNKFAVWGKYSINGLQIPRKKKFFINPSLKSVNEKIKKENQKYLSLFFYESKKFMYDFHTLQNFEVQNRILEELILFTKKLPKKIRTKILFRASKNHGLNSARRFDRQIFKTFNSYVNQKISSSFLDTIKKTKLMITNFPSTVFSETMSLNIPSLLYCNEKEILLDRKSKFLFLEMKKKKLAFDDIKKLSKHVKSIWLNPYKWWNNEKIQKLRKYYLYEYFNTLDDLKNSWTQELKK